MTDEPTTTPTDAATPDPAQDQPTPENAPQGATAAPQGDPPADGPGDELSRVRREAAARRVQLRDVEAERDRLAAIVEPMQREHVERIAAERLTDPGDLWLTVELADLRGDDGQVDDEKVKAALDSAMTERPHWRKTTPAPDFDAGARPEPAATQPDFAGGLRQAISRR